MKDSLLAFTIVATTVAPSHSVLIAKVFLLAFDLVLVLVGCPSAAAVVVVFVGSSGAGRGGCAATGSAGGVLLAVFCHCANLSS